MAIYQLGKSLNSLSANKHLNGPLLGVGRYGFIPISGKRKSVPTAGSGTFEVGRSGDSDLLERIICGCLL